MFFVVLVTVLSKEIKSTTYSDLLVPCKVGDGVINPIQKLDHCNACASTKSGSEYKFSCLVCEEGYELIYEEDTVEGKAFYHCGYIPTPIATPKATQSATPSQTPTPSVSQTPTETPSQTPTPDNCPPCICDTALRQSSEQINNNNNQIINIIFIINIIMLFMVSYLFFKEWKPIVCNCKRPEYGQLPLTPPPSPPPPPFNPPQPTPFLQPTDTRSSRSSREEFSDN